MRQIIAAMLSILMLAGSTSHPLPKPAPIFHALDWVSQLLQQPHIETPPETEPVPPTQPAPTEPPATVPPVTEPPETETPATEPPILPAQPQPPATEPPETVPPAPAAAIVTEDALLRIRIGFLALVNAERSRVGAAPLSEIPYLDSCAQIRSVEIKNCWSHHRPDGSSFSTVVDPQLHPYSAIGENLGISNYLGTQTFHSSDIFVSTDSQIQQASATLFSLFCSSPTHYENMIKSSYTQCGIGIDYMIDEASGMPLFTISHIFAAPPANS